MYKLGSHISINPRQIVFRIEVIGPYEVFVRVVHIAKLRIRQGEVVVEYCMFWLDFYQLLKQCICLAYPKVKGEFDGFCYAFVDL